MTPDTFFPESPKEVWDDGASWLAPHFLDSATNISVAPVHQAGLTLLWEDSHQIDAGLRLDAAPGHPHASDAWPGMRE